MNAVARAIEETGVSRLPRIMNREQASEYLGVSADTLDVLHHSGKLPRVKIAGRVVLFDVKDLDRLVEQEKIR
jgi:excisionase family DNA binding protein